MYLHIKNLKLFVYDFDGVMTDNKVYIDQNGKEMVQVNRADGLGIAEIKKMGIKQIIISTEKNPVVSARANKLEIPCLQGVENKKYALTDYCQKNDIQILQVAYVGNDINDKDAMAIAVSLFVQMILMKVSKKSQIIFYQETGETALSENY